MFGLGIGCRLGGLCGCARLFGVGLCLQGFLTRPLDLESLAFGCGTCRRGVLRLDFGLSPLGFFGERSFTLGLRSIALCLCALALGLGASDRLLFPLCGERTLLRLVLVLLALQRDEPRILGGLCRLACGHHHLITAFALFARDLGVGQQLLRFRERVAGIAISLCDAGQLHGIPRLGEIERCPWLEWLHFEVGTLVHQV